MASELSPVAAGRGAWAGFRTVLPLLLICASVVLMLVVDDTASTIWWLLAVAGLIAWPRLRQAWQQDGLLRWQIGCSFALLLLFAINLVQADVVYDHIRLFEKFLRWASLGLVIGLCIPSAVYLRPFLLVTAVIALASAGLYGAMQRVDGVERVGGAVHCIFYGNLLMTLALICALAALSAWRWWRSLLLLACSCGGVAVSMWSGTRSSLLAVLLVGLIGPLLLRRRPPAWQWFLVPLLLVAMLAVSWASMTPRMSQRLEGVGNEIHRWLDDEPAVRRGSVGARLSTWQHCLTLWSQEPVFGVGIGDYRREMRALAQAHPHDADNAILWRHHAHSIFFHLLATTGLVGLTLVCLVLFVLPAMQFWRILRRVDDPRRRFPAIAGMAVVISFACYGLTETWVIISAFASAYLTLLAPLLAAAHQEWVDLGREGRVAVPALVERRSEGAAQLQSATAEPCPAV